MDKTPNMAKRVPVKTPAGPALVAMAKSAVKYPASKAAKTITKKGK